MFTWPCSLHLRSQSSPLAVAISLIPQSCATQPLDTEETVSFLIANRESSLILLRPLHTIRPQISEKFAGSARTNGTDSNSSSTSLPRTMARVRRASKPSKRPISAARESEKRAWTSHKRKLGTMIDNESRERLKHGRRLEEKATAQKAQLDKPEAKTEELHRILDEAHALIQKQEGLLQIYSRIIHSADKEIQGHRKRRRRENDRRRAKVIKFLMAMLESSRHLTT